MAIQEVGTYLWNRFQLRRSFQYQHAKSLWALATTNKAQTRNPVLRVACTFGQVAELSSYEKLFGSLDGRAEKF
jgi:hypothetical protein